MSEAMIEGHLHLRIDTSSVSLHDVSRTIFDALPGTEARVETHGAPFWVKTCKTAGRAGRTIKWFCHEPPAKQGIEEAPCVLPGVGTDRGRDGRLHVFDCGKVLNSSEDRCDAEVR